MNQVKKKQFKKALAGILATVMVLDSGVADGNQFLLHKLFSQKNVKTS